MHLRSVCVVLTLMGQTRVRSDLLLLDNASRHGQDTDLLFLKHVRVLFLPKRTTCILQALDFGIIACIKMLYEHRKKQNSDDEIKIGVTK